MSFLKPNPRLGSGCRLSDSADEPRKYQAWVAVSGPPTDQAKQSGIIGKHFETVVF